MFKNSIPRYEYSMLNPILKNNKIESTLLNFATNARELNNHNG